MIRNPNINTTKRTPQKIYQHRYLPDKQHVYSIIPTYSTVISSRFHDMMFYTEPYYNKEAKEHTNAILCFTSKDTAKYKIDNLKTKCIVDTSTLEDMKYFSLLLRVPLVVEIHSFCNIDEYTEHYDIYYFHKKHNSIDAIMDESCHIV